MKSKTDPYNPKGYRPVKQKPCCCVPATLQVILARHRLEGSDQEDLGNLMGLIVRDEVKNQFRNVASSKEPPPGGYGTRINLEEFSLKTVFNKLGLPLAVDLELIDRFKTAQALKKSLMTISDDADSDAFLCVQTGALEGHPSPVNGHVILLSAADEQKIYYLNMGCPEEGVKEASYPEMLDAMRLRGQKNWGGVWKIGKR